MSITDKGIMRGLRIYPLEPIETRETILKDFRQAWHEAMTEQTIPISQLWEGLE